MNYLTRNVNGTIISKNGLEINSDRSIKYIVNKMCLKSLSTYEGRIIAISKIFNYKTLTLIFDQSHNHPPAAWL